VHAVQGGIDEVGVPVVSFQTPQHWRGDMATELKTMRWLTYHAAWLAVRQRPGVTIELCMAKLFATERAQSIALDGMGLLGGRANLEVSGIAQRQPEVLLGLYAGGTNEIQRNLASRWPLAGGGGATDA